MAKFECDGFGKKALKSLLDFFHPVKEVIFVEDDNFDPNVSWGGTWVRLPANYAIWTVTSGAGGTIEAGLPNIEGNLPLYGFSDMQSAYATNGAFSKGNNSPSFGLGNRHNDWTGIHFSAKDYNSIYGKSSTVQPPAYKLCAWKRTA